MGKRNRVRENGRFFSFLFFFLFWSGGTRSLWRAGFKSSLSPVFSWLWGQWFLSSSRSLGIVRRTARETLMIWQPSRGGENPQLPQMHVWIFIVTLSAREQRVSDEKPADRECLFVDNYYSDGSFPSALLYTRSETRMISPEPPLCKHPPVYKSSAALCA